MGNFRVEIYVQARMSSTRLPGKVLKEVLDKPLLEYLMERLKRVEQADAVVILTTTNPNDEPIRAYCEEHKVLCYQGPEDDVLKRYYEVAKKRQPDAIVRITSDCPLIDPKVIDEVIATYKARSTNYDYVSNSLTRTYPRGMDTEIFSYEALEKAFKEAQANEEKEHVTLYMYRHPELFRLMNVAAKKDFSNFRLTVDTEDDFKLIQTLLTKLYPQNPQFTLGDIIDVLQKHPEWVAINAHVEQKPITDQNTTR
jgi:spore coat polysaccharide biosynthesis protein SpsF